MTSGDFDREGVGYINETLEEGRDKLLGQRMTRSQSWMKFGWHVSQVTTLKWYTR